ncbi:MAG: DUF488 family protein [Planctomycetota bacterium]
MRVLTVGHSTRTLEELVACLRAHGVRELCDVRAWPTSARHPHFARRHLERALPEQGIAYSWWGEALGGFRKKGRTDSPHTALRSRGFRNYADHMEGAEFLAAISDLLRRPGPVALMCAERHWSRCHRSFISDHLAGLRGVEVVHILDEQQTEPHRLRRAARITDGRIVYDRAESGDGLQRALF